jgi:hypothetical protein
MASSAGQKRASQKYRQLHPQRAQLATKNWVERNKVPHTRGRLQWRVANHSRILLKDAEKRAKRKGLPFDIVVADIVIPSYCPVLGIPLYYGAGKRTANSPSVDRIVPGRGYVRGNIAVVSWRANELKRNGTLEELKKLVLWLELQREQEWLN